MKHALKTKSPSRARAGAQDREAGAIEYPCLLNSLYPLQAQFLIAAHHVRPELANMLAALAFGGGASYE
jgi:hypothetical protein